MLTQQNQSRELDLGAMRVEITSLKKVQNKTPAPLKLQNIMIMI